MSASTICLALRSHSRIRLQSPFRPFTTTPTSHLDSPASASTSTTSNTTSTTTTTTPLSKPSKRTNPTVGPKLAALRRAGAPSTKIAQKEGRTACQITALCLADSFNMPSALRILKKSQNLDIDPHATGLSPSEVIHAHPRTGGGDIFVFRSGTVVTWGVPLDTVTPALLGAAVGTLPIGDREVEDLDYVEDAHRENSWLKGDLITLGTKPPGLSTNPPPDSSTFTTAAAAAAETATAQTSPEAETAAHNITLAKVAFSSALARSTRLAVLENKMEQYGASTNDFTNLPLDSPARLRSSRRMILQLSKDLLILRARLNHHSELTDPIPDLFWDSRAELGLERYFEQVSEALDISVRIEILNQRLDYAQEIVGTIRTMGTEQESTRLEWIIILLITVEVIFETRRIVAEVREESRSKIERLAKAPGIPLDSVTGMPVQPSDEETETVGQVQK